MNAITDPSLSSLIPAVPGTKFEGGFFFGTSRVDDDVSKLIIAPKALGRHAPVVWHPDYTLIEGANSFSDGMANTIAMAKAGCPLGIWALSLNIDGFNDWYIPSRDELELLYRAFKPTTDANYVYRNGDNPSSVPPGYPYTEDSPAQTIVEAFLPGGSEAIEPKAIWSSTQCSADYAWGQDFGDGGQYAGSKGGKFLGVAVRRLVL